jgi:hypothetical protein
MPALRNPKHESICRDVAGGASWDHAWVLAGNSPNSRNVGRLKSDPRIQARVAELRAEFNAAGGIQLRWLQEQLLPIATSDVTSYFEADDAGKLALRDVTKLPPELRSALSELRIDSDGQVTVKTWNKTDAINSLLKTTGGFAASRIEISAAPPEHVTMAMAGEGFHLMRSVAFTVYSALRAESADTGRQAAIVEGVRKAIASATGSEPGWPEDAETLVGEKLVRSIAVPLILTCQRVVEGGDAGGVKLLLQLLRDMTSAVAEKSGLSSGATTA